MTVTVASFNMASLYLYAGKIFPGLRRPCGSKAALTRFISAISSGESSSEHELALWRIRCRARR